MYNPTTRLLTILELLQSRGEVSGQELAQALEVEERSIRRYIMMLRDIGIPIEGTPGRHGGYSLRPGFRLPPMMFNTDEITAVMMGLMLMREMGSTSLHAIESATAKIERVLPDELRQATEAMKRTLIFNDVEQGAHALSSERIIAFSRAVHEGRCLTITYGTREGEITERLIAPYGLVQHARRWYIPAYCFLREDIRVFRMDRIHTISPSEQFANRPADFNARDTVLDSLARMPSTYAFEVLLHVPLMTAQASIPPATAVLEAEGEETHMRCYSDDAHWFARLLVHIDLPFTVLQTDELRDALQELTEKILRGIQR
jgi:predicted DNA-binding transcriptional regulator YafY